MPRVKPTARDLPTDLPSLVQFCAPMAIHDEVAYGNAMELIDALTSVPKMSRGQKEYLDTLSILVEAYENEHHGFSEGDVSPLDALSVLLEEHGMSASDLGRLLGERTLGPKILNGQRELSKAHIRTLCHHFKVSADVFI